MASADGIEFSDRSGVDDDLIPALGSFPDSPAQHLAKHKGVMFDMHANKQVRAARS